MTSFLRTLAWLFYWIRFETAVLQQPNTPVSITTIRGRWRIVFGENIAEGPSGWQAIRHLIDGLGESEPLELTPEALQKAADDLAQAAARDRDAAAARELEAQAARDAAAAAASAQVAELERDRERNAAEPPAPARKKSGPELALEAEEAAALERSRHVLDMTDGGKDDDERDELAEELELEHEAVERAQAAEPEPDPQPRRGFFGRRKGF